MREATEVYVSWQRQVVTLRSPMKVRVRVLHCPDHQEIYVYPKPMRRLFLPGCRFDMNVMNAVGLLRWGLCLQREEIQILLMDRGVTISTGEISYLSERFLVYFSLLHRSKYPERDSCMRITDVTCS
ncbi:hypothetical protein IPdc08_00226 [archaeon]|nr:hypothetical protein IPdc08_00226 [archaeon]